MYSKQQELFLTYNNHKHIFINAGPGTGKTTLIKEKIKRLLSQDKRIKILYLTFSVKLAYEVKQELNLQTLKRITVGTIHSLLTKFIKSEVNSNFIIVEKKNIYFTNIEQLTFSDIEKTTLKNLTHFKQWLQKRYRYIFIDEIQDINANLAKLINSLIEPNSKYSLYLLGDVNQTIYQKNLSDTGIITAIENNKYIYKLQLNHTFRLGQKTCNLVNLLFNIKLTPSKNKSELLNFLTEQHSKIPRILSILLSKWIKTTTQLAEEYLTRTERLLKFNITPESKTVVVLARHNNTIDKLLNYFLKKNLPVHKIGTLLKTEQTFINSYQQFLYQALNNKTYIITDSMLPNLKSLLQTTRLPKIYIHKFLKTNNVYKSLELLYIAKKFLENSEDTTAINLSTIHKAKGLEFETVILSDFYNDIYKLTKKYDKNLLFVALTRHLKQLIIFSNMETINQLPNKQKILKEVNVIKKLLHTLPLQQTLF